MKTKELMLSLLVMLGVSFFGAISAHATTWYVRDGGGAYGTTPTTCNGLYNVVYTTGNGPNCAVSHPVYIMGGGYPGSGSTARWSGGDTLYINGDSDISSGNQAVYNVGYGMPYTSGCGSGYQYNCYLNNIPAGTSGAPTSVIGTGTHKPQLLAVNENHDLFDAENNYITLQNIEFTTINGNGYDGVVASGTGGVYTDLYIHGFGHYGFNGGAFGSATWTRVWTIGNYLAGIQIGSAGNQAVTGTLTFNQPIVEWSGCKETYPVTGGIDNPANYYNCWGQDSGGYGDGLAFGATGSEQSGNWTIIGPGSISFNTQDGLDTLHGTAGNQTMKIDKMRFEGNAGQQIKAVAFNTYITNSIIIGDCGWWQGSAQAISGGMSFASGDACRAAGDTILVNVTKSSTTLLYNNTILTSGIAIDYKDTASTGCNSSTVVTSANNIILGGYYWLDDTAWNSTGGNSQTTYLYAAGNDGDGTGTCGHPGNGSGGLLTPTSTYNIVSGNKSSNSPCGGTGDKCGTAPGFANTIPMGTSGGAANTYYQGTAAASLVSLSGTSPAVAAGVAGLTYWNSGNDYHNVARTNPPSIGGVEASSCAAGSYGCFFNSDCCAGSCSNFVCGGTSALFGDVTNAGNVTLYDAELTAQYVVGLQVAGFNPTNAEVDGTGKVDIYDAYLIAEYAVGKITKFPVQS